MKRFCLALDLKDDATLIAEYEERHRKVWAEVLQSIRDAGVQQAEIYRVNNRLVMVIEADDDFTFGKKAAMDAANEKVQEWEHQMWKYQVALPGTKPGEKWRLMEKVFSLNT
jgi:L-rhamnose mutarotase